MLEATRLTREGKLAEATASLQRAMAGDEPPMAAATKPAADAPGRDGQASRIIDINPETGEVLAPRPAGIGAGLFGAAPGFRSAAWSGQTAMPPFPAGLRGLLDRAVSGAPSRTAAALPQGAQFVSRSFENHAGGRNYKLFVPGGRQGGAMPLVVMLHGCTQSPDDFAAGTRMNALAEVHGCLVAYPEQAQSANAQRCWNWFSPGDQQRDHGEPALIAGITRAIMHDHAANPQRVYVAGLSAGGAAAAIMGTAYPDLYAAIGVHSGLACGAARDMPSAFAAMRKGDAGSQRSSRNAARAGRAQRMPAIVFHGDKDGTVHPRNGDQVMAQFGTAGLRNEVTQGQVSGGHAYTRTQHFDAADQPLLEHWVIHGAGHAWSGGSGAGSYTDPRGPDASHEMLRFFLARRLDSRTA